MIRVQIDIHEEGDGIDYIIEHKSPLFLGSTTYLERELANTVSDLFEVYLDACANKELGPDDAVQLQVVRR